MSLRQSIGLREELDGEGVNDANAVMLSEILKRL